MAVKAAVITATCQNNIEGSLKLCSVAYHTSLGVFPPISAVSGKSRKQMLHPAEHRVCSDTAQPDTTRSQPENDSHTQQSGLSPHFNND